MNKSRLFIFGLAILTIIVIAIFLYQPSLPIAYLNQKYADNDSKFINIDGNKVHYKIEGDTGEFILLIHGTASSLHTWDGWTKSLKSTNKVVRLDLPAFGLTGPFSNRDYKISHYVTFIREFLKELEISKINLVGNSLGGQIALQFSIDYPQIVNKLILLDASGLPTGQDRPLIFKIARNKIGAFIIKNTLPKFIIKNNLEAVYFNDSMISPELIDRYYELSLRPGNRQAFIDRANTEVEVLKNLQEIKSQTLILWGKHDKWIPMGNALKFKSMIPNNRLVILDQAGHIPMEELPEVSVQLVSDFLKEQIN